VFIRRFSRHAFACALSALAFGVASLFTLVGSAMAASGSASPAVEPALALPHGVRDLGRQAAGRSMSFEVGLEPQDPAALASFAASVSTPGSPEYRQYLAKGQFGARFGASPAAIAAVQSALAGAGLTVGAVTPDDLLLRVSGTTAEIDTAFDTTLDQVRLASGATTTTNVTAIHVPAAIAGDVESVIGLDNATQLTSGARQAPKASSHSSVSPQTVGVNGTTPCAAASDTGSWTANQIAQAYGLDPIYNTGHYGANQNIALVEMATWSSSDVATYQSCYGTSVSVGTTTVDGGATGTPSSEDMVDIEDAIGLAPHAAIQVYDSPNTLGDMVDVYDKIETTDEQREVSDSWYACETDWSTSEIDELNTIQEAMGANGQSSFALTGDVGSHACGSSTLGVAEPSSQPNLTSVGGTDLNALGNPPVQAPSETAWVSGGGGISSQWTMPSYQQGAGVINTYSSGTPCKASSGDYCREIPDVSADAGSTYAMYVNGAWGNWYGTSLSTPTWASATAMINDSSSSCQSKPVGFLNPSLYDLAATTPADFNDITIGNNGNNDGDLYPATANYDLATGLGSLNAANLAQSLCGGVLWTPQANNTTVVGTPSAAAYDGTLYVTYLSAGKVEEMSETGTTWTTPALVKPGGTAATAKAPPSIAVEDGTVWVVWANKSNNHVEASYLKSTGKWAAAVRIGAGTAIANSGAAPAVTAFGDELYAVWNDAGNVYFSIYDSGSWGSATELSGTDPAGGLSVAYDPANVGLLIGWNTTTGAIQYTIWSPFGQSAVDTAPGSTSLTPAVANVGDELYLAYTDSSGDVQVESANRGDITDWGAAAAVPSAQTSGAPAFATSGPTLWALWGGHSAGTLWWSESDPPQS
jgi:hypothetical protein